MTLTLTHLYLLPDLIMLVSGRLTVRLVKALGQVVDTNELE
jgi:hypothetical protein